MRKKIKLIFTTIFLTAVVIASIIEIGKVLNISKTNIEYSELKKTEALDNPKENSWLGGSLDGKDTTAMYKFVPDHLTYCASHGLSIALREHYIKGGPVLPDKLQGGRAQVVTYERPEDTEMAQSIAYGIKFGASDEQLQNIIWATKTWQSFTGGCCLREPSEDVTLYTTSPGIEGRATQFANFVYLALDNNELELESKPEKEDDKNLKIIVKQAEKSYTVGPYTVSFKNQDRKAICGNETMGELVYNEIIEKNPSYSRYNAYCVGEVGAKIIFEDGTKKIVDGSEIAILDMNEKPMEHNFPKFGEKFLIKYIGGDKDIKEIKPLIRISYLKKITNKGKTLFTYTYEATEIVFKMNFDDEVPYFHKAVEEEKKSFFRDEAYDYVIQDEGEGGTVDFSTWVDGGSVKDQIDSWSSTTETGINNYMVDVEMKWLEVRKKPSVDFKKGSGMIIEGEFYKIDSEPSHTETITGSVVAEYDEETGLPKKYTYTAEAKSTLPGKLGELKGTGTADSEAEAKKNALSDLCSQLKGLAKYGLNITDIEVNADLDGLQPVVVVEREGEGDGDGLWRFKGTLTKEQLDVDVQCDGDVDHGVAREEFHGREINMFIGGNVWQDMPSEKLGEFTGKREPKSLVMAGIQVELYDKKDDKLWSVTTTDEHGEYGFQKLNPMHKYYIVFRYDGMRYDDTDFNNKLTGGYSTAKEKASDRKDFNEKFSQIGSSPNNYDGNKKAYRSVHQTGR